MDLYEMNRRLRGLKARMALLCFAALVLVATAAGLTHSWEAAGVAMLIAATSPIWLILGAMLLWGASFVLIAPWVLAYDLLAGTRHFHEMWGE